MTEKKVPENLKIISATKEEISMSEVSYSADIIVGIISTENFLAPLRGRKSVFLGYEGKGMGGDLLNIEYSKEILDAIDKDKNVNIVSSPEDFASYLKKQKHIPEKAESPKVSQKKTKTPTQKILDIVLLNKIKKGE